jgi:hypothetical protein
MESSQVAQATNVLAILDWHRSTEILRFSDRSGDGLVAALESLAPGTWFTLEPPCFRCLTAERYHISRCLNEPGRTRAIQYCFLFFIAIITCLSVTLLRSPTVFRSLGLTPFSFIRLFLTTGRASSSLFNSIRPFRSYFQTFHNAAHYSNHPPCSRHGLIRGSKPCPRQNPC